MITSINEFKQTINENTDVKDPNFDEFIKANASKLVNRTSKYIPQLNQLLRGKGFLATGGSREGFRIENEQGETVLSARMFRDLMEKLRELARPFIASKETSVKAVEPAVTTNKGIAPTKVNISTSNGQMSVDELKDKYGSSVSIDKIGINPSREGVELINKYADDASVYALHQFIKNKQGSIDDSWSRITYGTPFYYSEKGNAAKAAWKQIISDLLTKLNNRIKAIKIKTPSGKILTLNNGELFVNGIKIVANSKAGYVHQSNRGHAVSMSPGAFYSPNTGKDQLQGNTYVYAYNMLVKRMMDGMSWNDIDSELSDKRTPYSKDGEGWKSLKKYLGLN